MSRERQKTDVKVKVLDMSGLESKAFQYIKNESNLKDKEFVTAVSSGEKIGYITTSKGIFVLSADGVGSNKPISQSNLVIVDFSVDYDRAGEKSFSMAPVMSLKLDDKAILDIPVLREENLETFIRRFGTRLESNYEEWKEAMEKEMVPA